MQRNGKGPRGAAVTQQAPAVAQQTPAVAQQTPGVAQQTPGVARQTPGVAQQTPAVAQQAARRRSAGAYRSDDSIARRLLAAQVMLDKILADPALQSALVPYGYDLARILQGKALRDQVQALAQQQCACSGDQRSARDARDAARSQAHAFYMRQVALARVALRDDSGAAQKLGLTAARGRRPADWLMQAQQFYANALSDPAILAKLAACGLTGEQLAQGQAHMAAVATSLVAHEQRRETKQATTQARDAALLALDRWMRDFTTVARVALAEQPQALDQLVVVATPQAR